MASSSVAITCPDGCGPGDAIDLEIPAPPGGGGDGSSGEAPPAQVEVVVPDGCYPGMEFTVDFDGRTFNIAVPDGCEPGMALTVEVPAQEPAAPASNTRATKVEALASHTSRTDRA